jgi:hypothetical protein
VNEKFWDSLKSVGPVGIFVVLSLLVTLKYGPNLIKALRNGRNGRNYSTKPLSGEETTESWVTRIEGAVRRVLDESWEGRDAHIQEVFSRELELFFTRVKEYLAIVAKQRELDQKSEELEELRRKQHAHKHEGPS